MVLFALCFPFMVDSASGPVRVGGYAFETSYEILAACIVLLAATVSLLTLGFVWRRAEYERRLMAASFVILPVLVASLLVTGCALLLVNGM